MRPGRAPTLQLRAPASVSFGAEKGSLGQGSREGGRGAEPAQPFAGAAGGRGLAAGMEGATTACAAPRGGEVALRSTARHGSVALRGTAWHSVARHRVLPGMPLVRRDKTRIRAFPWEQRSRSRPSPAGCAQLRPHAPTARHRPQE